MSLPDIVIERFWLEWEDRFEDNHQKFITPQSVMVKSAARKVPNIGDDKQRAIAANRWVHDNIRYRLSKKWKTPVETLSSKLGDCEDVTFLLASMFPHLGIDESELVIGNLRINGGVEFHTWNRVNGQILDCTADPDIIQPDRYDERKSYLIKHNKGKKCKTC